jgi:hypothetical protein
MSEHQHEEWQMLESAKGGRYCGACGEHEVIPVSIRDLVGIAPNWTDGMGSVEWVRAQRARG